jgi:FkbM family methyltransferase
VEDPGSLRRARTYMRRFAASVRLASVKVREAIIALLPHGVVEGVRGRRMLTRLGAATTRRGSAARARDARLDLLPPGALREIETVVDVGAHEGRWSSAVLSLARPGHLIAVEPSPQVLPSLHEALRGFPATVLAAAIGNSIGEATLKIATNSYLTSVLNPRSQEMNALYGAGYDVAHEVVVPMTTLDEITRGIGDVSLLKLDVQGAERAAIEGGSTTLAGTRWLLIETNFRSHYEGDLLFPELHAMLAERGFRLVGMSPPFMSSGVAVWADSLYERA